MAVGVFLRGNVLAATVPPGFTETIISGPWSNAVGITFENTGRMYVWEGTGQVWFKDPGDANYTLLLDIHDEVGAWGDHGMLGFALDPDFRVNGYIYVLYVVDRYYLFHSGDPDYDPNANEYNDGDDRTADAVHLSVVRWLSVSGPGQPADSDWRNEGRRESQFAPIPMELGAWYSVRMERCWCHAETEPVPGPPTLVALNR